jgi:hypothetical protein
MKLKKKQTYRLWSFQSVRAIKELKSKGILQSSWDLYYETGYFTKAYQWMAKQLVERNINDNNHPPIWAWHSCSKYEHPPRLVDARGLLSDSNLEDGRQTIEFECPVEMVLLSSYRMWNMMLYEIFDSNEEIKIDMQIVDELFATQRKQFKKYDSIQATLPYLLLDWVKDIRPLNLKPGDFSYNEEDKV